MSAIALNPFVEFSFVRIPGVEIGVKTNQGQARGSSATAAMPLAPSEQNRDFSDDFEIAFG